MNRKQRRIQDVQGRHASTLHVQGKACTIEEADALAARARNTGNFKAALDIYTLLLARLPRHPEVCNARGLVLHDMRRYEEALASYAGALALDPHYGEAHNNRGLALHELKRYEEALASYDSAVALRPEYREIHLNRIVTLQQMRRYTEALSCCDAALKLFSDSAEGYCYRALCLHKLHRYEEALADYDRALALRPGYAEVYNNRGVTLQELKRNTEALASYNQALALQPDYAGACQNKGLILANQGHMEEAVATFERAYGLKQSFAAPLFSLSTIRKYTDAGHTDVGRIRTMLALPELSVRDKEYLFFALGKIYDDCELYDEAFGYYRQGNLLRNATVSYNAAKIEADVSSFMKVFNPEFFVRQRGCGSPSRAPVFIVGMPRSGTTLLAAILSNHPAIGSAGELQEMKDCSAQLSHWTGSEGAYLRAVDRINTQVAKRLAEAYELRLRRGQSESLTHIIDKHPLNFWHLGVIALLFPRATVIHCTRHPLDTVVSNYFQLFSREYDYAFDLENIAHYYRQYTRLMEHWQKVLPLEVTDIAYAGMVRQTESVARRLLDMLHLPWDERCLAPHTNPHAVETASQWQVRRPIYTSSVERWQKYQAHLSVSVG